MTRYTRGWNPVTHRLSIGATWSISRNRGALVALRGRSGVRVEEIRLVDKTRPRKQDYASNTVVVAIDGRMHTEQESQCLYQLCRAWWQRRSQLAELGTTATFHVHARADGRYFVHLQLHGVRGRTTTALESLASPVLVRSQHPDQWEHRGLQLLDIAVSLLRGEDVDVAAFHLTALTESF